MHPDAEADGDRCREELAAELLPPAQAAQVVDRADGRRDRRAEQEAAHRRIEVEERERRDEDAEEEREPAEPRHRARVRAALVAGPLDDAEQARHPADRRREQHDDHQRDAEP